MRKVKGAFYIRWESKDGTESMEIGNYTNMPDKGSRASMAVKLSEYLKFLIWQEESRP